MILFHDIVQVLAAANPDRVFATEVELVPHTHAMQRGVAGPEGVERDGPRLAVALQCFAEESFCRCDVTGAAQIRLYGPAAFINRPVQKHPAAVDPEVSPVGTPGAAHTL